MGSYLIEKEDADRILQDASTAIDMLERIKSECYKSVVFSTYVREKAKIAKECVDFILNHAEEVIREARRSNDE